MKNSSQNQSLDEKADALLNKTLDALLKSDSEEASKMTKQLNVMNSVIRLAQARTRLKNNLKMSAMSLASGVLGGGLLTVLLKILE